jgi:hypothetical protein
VAQDDVSAGFGSAVDTWHETGSASVDCPACAATVPLPAWIWADDILAFAHLGFEFWNWPTLSDDFRARMTGFLDGHRTVFLQGKI